MLLQIINGGGKGQTFIYIYKALCLSVCPSVTLLFVPGGQTICLSPGGQTFFTHRWGGQTNCLSPGDKHFSHTSGGGTNKLFVPRGQTFFTHRGGDKHFSYDDENCRECERSEHSFERSEKAPCRG